MRAYTRQDGLYRAFSSQILAESTLPKKGERQQEINLSTGSNRICFENGPEHESRPIGVCISLQPDHDMHGMDIRRYDPVLGALRSRFWCESMSARYHLARIGLSRRSITWSAWFVYAQQVTCRFMLLQVHVATGPVHGIRLRFH